MKKKHNINGIFKRYFNPKARRVIFFLSYSMTMLFLILFTTNNAVAGPWPVFNIKDYEDAAAGWASDCFPEASVRRPQYVGCPGNKVGHHAVTVYLTGDTNIMKFDIRDERISDELVEVVVDSVVCQKGAEKIDCPCVNVLWNAKEVKNKKQADQYKTDQQRKKQ